MAAIQARFDAIVIGSGIGGLSAAAALAKRGRRVLVLEQHFQIGGLTQTFRRGPYCFATGVHYIGGVGPGRGREGEFRRMLEWLTDGRLRFAPIGSPYDVVRLPGLEFPIEAPAEAYIQRLKETFPEEGATIDQFFSRCEKAMRASRIRHAAQAMPSPIATALRWYRRMRAGSKDAITTAQAVSECRDQRLAAILSARWADYGVPPTRSPLAVHALVMGSYLAGAYYPVGGPGQLASALAQTIRAAGGELRTRSRVTGICATRSRVTGVLLKNGEAVNAPVVISAMGAHNTAAVLAGGAAESWKTSLRALQPGLSYVSLYLGLRGDIRAFGATAANVWIYESLDIDSIWERPGEEEAPALYVSFSSLKDPAHLDTQHHTVEVVVLCNWDAFAAWQDSRPGRRPADYASRKASIEQILLAQFARHFPQLAPLIDLHEVSTPLSQASFVAAERGAMYGLEMTVERLDSRELGIRTPVAGLRLGGQDAASPGIQGAFMGGFMAAASIEPALWRQLSR